MNLQKAEIVVIGSEVLLGKRTDTNSSFLGLELARIGVEVLYKTTIRDERVEMMETIQRALDRSPLVITTGGLGPTLDDLTREILSQATKIPLRRDEDLARIIRKRFEDRGMVYSNTNDCQCLIPEKGGYYPNPNGTAPGLFFQTEKNMVVALPGPPPELRPIVCDYLIPHLLNLDSLLEPRLEKGYVLSGTGESNLDEKIREIVREDDPVSVSSLPRPGIVEVTFFVDGRSDREKARLAEVTEAFEKVCGFYVVGPLGVTLEEIAGDLLRKRGQTLGVAESCTGGLIGSRITSVAGSSDYFRGGIIAYANEIKENVLKVPHAVLLENGAVSENVARDMAEGCREFLGCDWAISVTGIAGPGGGTPEKPVGLVYIGLAGPDGVTVRKHNLFGDRDMIRERTVIAALNLLRCTLLQT